MVTFGEESFNSGREVKMKLVSEKQEPNVRSACIDLYIFTGLGDSLS